MMPLPVSSSTYKAEPETPTQHFLEHLENLRPSGSREKEWSARCPAHDDQNNSLSVAEGDDGRVLLNCFAGCAVEDIVHALGMQMHDLFASNGKGTRKPPFHIGRRKPNAKALLDFLRIDYTLTNDDEEARLVCPVCSHPDRRFYLRIVEPVGLFHCNHCEALGLHDGLEQLLLEKVVRESEQVTDYWRGRGISQEIIHAARLGYYAPLNRYTVPYIDSTGKITNIAFRAAEPDHNPKYLRLPGKISQPYVVGARGAEKTVVITEGEVDALSVHQACPDALVIGIPGAAAVNDSLLGAIPKDTRVIAICDNDGAGKAAARKLQERIPGIEVSFPDGIKDVNALLCERGAEAVRTLVAGVRIDGGVPETAQSRQVGLVADGVPEPEPPLRSLLDNVEAFLRRYVAFSSPHQVVALALWVAHTHTLEAADATPYIAITSPEKRSGKSRALEVVELLVARPWRAILPSEAVLFRKMTADRPTLLLDEVDAIFRDKTSAYEPLRALLNAGHRRGTRVPRCVGDGRAIRVEEFEVFGPKALAAIGDLPDTVADRSIPIRLARRGPQEYVEPFRHRDADRDVKSLRDGLTRWGTSSAPALREARPEVPHTLNDRAADGWEPLFAIADLAGGDWPRRARESAVALHGDPFVQEETVGVALLGAIHAIFQESGTDRIATAGLIKALVERDDGPWAEWWGRAVAAGDTRGPGHRLSRQLRQYGIASRTIRIDTGTRKGYDRADFEDAFRRYLPPIQGEKSNNVTTQVNQALAVDLTTKHGEQNGVRKALESTASDIVTFLGPQAGGNGEIASVQGRQGRRITEADLPRSGRTEGKLT